MIFSVKRISLPLALCAAVGSCTTASNEAEHEAGTKVSVPVAPPSKPQAAQPALPADNALPVIERSNLQQGGWLLGRASGDVAGISYLEQSVEIGPDGQFFVGFDRDAPTDATLNVSYEDGSLRSMPFTLTEGKWDLQYVNVPYTAGVPSAEFQRRRSGELEQIEAARSLSTGATGWRQRFIWPVRGRISGVFGAQRVYQGKPGPYHGGLDIAVPTGTSFVAPADGTVILAAKSPFTLEGYLLMIDHGAGLNSAFLHCLEISVSVGDEVRQGQLIGKVGATGRATGPHLHWSLKWQDARIDPLLILE